MSRSARSRQLRTPLAGKSARRLLRPLGIALSALLVFSGLTIADNSSAVAAEPVLVSGTVFADANKNNARDMSGAAGEVDLGVEGVAVTLACVVPADSAHAGWSTVTDANGNWSFPADTDLTACTDDQLHVTINTEGAAGNGYAVHNDSNTDNAFEKLGEENQQARSTTFSANAESVVLNALVWPTWKLDLALPYSASGLDKQAVSTGSAPWDKEAGAGYDQRPDDTLVRSGDLTKFTWSVTASAEESLADTFSSAVLEQTIHL